MPSKKSQSLLVLFSLIFILAAKNSSAQFPGMAQVRTNLNNQLMTQQMMNNFGGGKRSEYSSRIPGKFNEYTYLVKMKDGTTKNVKSYIYIDTTLHKSYLLFVDKSVPKSDTAHRKQKIFADQTLSIARTSEFIDSDDTTGSIKHEYFTGIATDSCW
jgi:hypothetical protein